jgi:hypothetical protein
MKVRAWAFEALLGDTGMLVDAGGQLRVGKYDE